MVKLAPLENCQSRPAFTLAHWADRGRRAPQQPGATRYEHSPEAADVIPSPLPRSSGHHVTQGIIRSSKQVLFISQICTSNKDFVFHDSSSKTYGTFSRCCYAKPIVWRLSIAIKLSLHYDFHFLEMEYKNPKFECDCPCGGMIKQLHPIF